jgi:hypothetical protein
MEEKIPRRIIQFYYQTDKSKDLPLLAKASAANMRLLNPDFEYLFFDDVKFDAFIDAEFPQFRSMFDSFELRIQCYDLFRYLAIYRLGGFYFDTDVILASGVKDLLEFGCVFPFEQLTLNSFLSKQYGMDWEIGNYAFGAAPSHPFIGAIIKNCVRAQKHPEWVAPMLKAIPGMFRDEFYVLATTGPGLVSRTLAEYPEASSEVKVLFPEDVCDPKSWFGVPNYGVHLQSGAWRSHKGMLYRVLFRRWQAMTRKALLKENLERGGKRNLNFKGSSLMAMK